MVNIFPLLKLAEYPFPNYDLGDGTGYEKQHKIQKLRR
jgi:hypothetical protein